MLTVVRASRVTTVFARAARKRGWGWSGSGTGGERDGGRCSGGAGGGREDVQVELHGDSPQLLMEKAGIVQEVGKGAGTSEGLGRHEDLIGQTTGMQS